MNPELLDLALGNKPHATLQLVSNEKSNANSPDGISRLSFKTLSELGEVIGYIKTWHYDDDYAGFVYFDPDGNIIEWKAFTKHQYSKTRN